MPKPSSVTRFLFDHGHYVISTGRVKPRAFEPSIRDNTTSVFVIDGLPDQAIWNISTLHIAPLRGRDAAVRADIPSAAIEQIDLALDVDDTPPGHAAIVGWPPEKDRVKMLAQQLAADAVLHVKAP